MKKTKLSYIIPFAILFTLLSLLCRELYSAPNDPRIPGFSGEPVPAFSLPYINNANKSFSQQDLRGHISILNIWASWCGACKMEHGMLMKISKQYGIPVYGILYKDDARDARRYLAQHGNPYRLVGDDKYGDTGIDFGIYGTPETYIIGPNGDILYRQVGVMTPRVWNKRIYPLIKPYLKK